MNKIGVKRLQEAYHKATGMTLPKRDAVAMAKILNKEK